MRILKNFPLALVLLAVPAQASDAAGAQGMNCCDAQGACEYVASFSACATLLRSENRAGTIPDEGSDEEAEVAASGDSGSCASGTQLDFAARGGELVLVDACEPYSLTDADGNDLTTLACVVRRVECGIAASDGSLVDWPLFEERTLALESWLTSPIAGEVYWLLTHGASVVAAQRTGVPQCE